MKFEDFSHTLFLATSVMPTAEIENTVGYLTQFMYRVYVIGNGGSLSLASHFAQDLNKKCGISAFALIDPCIITAYGNDEEFDSIFVRQLENHMVYGDCLIAFSSSGNSKDVYNACKFAKEFGAKIISFTGFSGGVIRNISDFPIHVPAFNYGIVETLHSLIFHYIIERLNTNDN